MKAFEILLVEDNQSYVSLMMEALEESQVLTNMNVVMDGAEAMAFVRREGKYIHSPRPDLILLDLNIPKKKGQKVLEEIKNDPDLKRIPVVIFTVSSAEQDILMSYNLHANSYIIKPRELDQFMAAVKSTINYWFTVVKLPPGK
ncbi:Response regulator rcp1 [Methanosarcinales archaeon]|nr:Response regulator rcp1 [Methanosarcinales archaeon]